MEISKAFAFALLAIFSAAQARAPPDEKGSLIGRVCKFESKNSPLHYIRQKEHEILVDMAERSEVFEMDSTWKIVSGLCDRGISFQSTKNQDYYLRNTGPVERLERFQETDKFRGDACFIPHRGLANGEGYSFECASYRGVFLVNRKEDHLLGAAQGDGSALFNNDATFLVREAQIKM